MAQVHCVYLIEKPSNAPTHLSVLMAKTDEVLCPIYTICGEEVVSKNWGNYDYHKILNWFKGQPTTSEDVPHFRSRKNKGMRRRALLPGFIFPSWRFKRHDGKY